MVFVIVESFVKSNVIVNKEFAWEKLIYRPSVLEQIVSDYFRLRRYCKFAILIMEIYKLAVSDVGNDAGVNDCILIGLLVDEFCKYSGSTQSSESINVI